MELHWLCIDMYMSRFRIPRPTVLDQGTQAVLEFLRRRLGE